MNCLGACQCRYYLARPGTLREPQHSTLLEQVLGHHEALDVEGKLRRRSVQVLPFFFFGITKAALER